MYVVICADRASIRVEVAFVRKIISYGAVGATSIIRSHISSVAPRVTMNILIRERRYIPKYDKAREKNYRKSFHDSIHCCSRQRSNLKHASVDSELSHVEVCDRTVLAKMLSQVYRASP